MRGSRFLPMALVLLLTSGGCGSGSGDQSQKVCCPESCYPAAGESAGQVLYVNSSCPEEGADGSLAHPYLSIVDAVKAAEAGAALLVAEGEYGEDQPIVIKKSLSVAGMGKFEPATGGYVDKTIIVVKDSTALSVLDAQQVSLRGLTIKEPTVAGIDVHDSENLEIIGNHVQFAQRDSAGLFGHGIVVSASTGVLLAENLVDKGAGVGILAHDSGLLIKDNRVSWNEQGIRLENCPPAGAGTDDDVEPVEIVGNRVDLNAVCGVNVLSSLALIEGNEILDTRAVDGDVDGIADGILISRSETVGARSSRVWLGGKSHEGEGNVVAGSGRAGVLVSGGSQVELIVNNIIEENAGRGVWIQEQSSVKSMVSNTIGRNALIGVGLTGGSNAAIGGAGEGKFNLIFETFAVKTVVDGETVEIGDGVGVFLQSQVTVQHNKILDNVRTGVILDDPDSDAVFVGQNRVDGGEYGIVVQAEEGSEVPLGKIVDNYKNALSIDACAPPACVALESSAVLSNYDEFPRLHVLDEPVSLPCAPPSCTD